MKLPAGATYVWQSDFDRATLEQRMFRLKPFCYRVVIDAGHRLEIMYRHNGAWRLYGTIHQTDTGSKIVASYEMSDFSIFYCIVTCVLSLLFLLGGIRFWIPGLLVMGFSILPFPAVMLIIFKAGIGLQETLTFLDRVCAAKHRKVDGHKD